MPRRTGFEFRLPGGYPAIRAMIMLDLQRFRFWFFYLGRFVIRRNQIARIDRQKFLILIRPSGGFGVERAFGVVGLVGDNLAYSYDKVDERFRGGPVVAYAYRSGVDVWVEDRRQHLAMRRAMRVISRQRNFDQVRARLDKLAVFTQHQSFDPVFDLVFFRRVACRFAQEYIAALFKPFAQLVVIGLKPSQAYAHIITPTN